MAVLERDLFEEVEEHNWPY